jgi:hypothetical protein
MSIRLYYTLLGDTEDLSDSLYPAFDLSGAQAD